MAIAQNQKIQMAKRNSSESSSGGRRSGRSNAGKSFSGKGKSTDRPYKKSDKSDSRTSGRGERSSSGPREERPYKKFDRNSSSKPSFRKPGENSDSSNRPFSSAPRGGGSSSDRPYKKFDKPFGKSTRRDENSSSEQREPKSFGSRNSEKPPYKKFDKPFDKKGREDNNSEKRGSRSFGSSSRSSSERPYKKFDKPFDRSGRDDNASEKRAPRSFGSSKSSTDRPFKKSDKAFDRPSREESASGKRIPRSFDSDKPKFDRPGKADDSLKKRPGGFSSTEKPYKKFDKPQERSSGSNEETPEGEETGRKSRGASFGLPYKREYDKPTSRKEENSEGGEKPFIYPRKFSKTSSKTVAPNLDTDIIRLNKYIANSGMCSRREADEYIRMGLVSVNGTVVTELGYKVKRSDEVRYEDRVLKAEKPVYILMNKPKGYITTTKDPQERNTVMHILEGKVKERIYPVGRLDRNTTGLLLLTNDGDLADKLMHPSYKAKKIYKVELDRPLTKSDFKKIQDGVFLEEGRAVVDDVAIVGDDGKTIGIEIHIGWNRVIRRIFEALGYDVVKLDRSVYAGLDKKELPRGHWRPLTTEEIVMLKHYKSK